MLKRGCLLVLMVPIAGPLFAFHSSLDKRVAVNYKDIPLIEHQGFQCGYHQLKQKLDELNLRSLSSQQQQQMQKGQNIRLEIGDSLELVTFDLRMVQGPGTAMRCGQTSFITSLS